MSTQGLLAEIARLRRENALLKARRDGEDQPSGASRTKSPAPRLARHVPPQAVPSSTRSSSTNAPPVVLRQDLVPCPQCGIGVRPDRLARHVAHTCPTVKSAKASPRPGLQLSTAGWGNPCPVCGTRLRPEELRAHVQDLHPFRGWRKKGTAKDASTGYVRFAQGGLCDGK